jgi:hypothetical protein
MLRISATNLLREDFSWPPEDDGTINKIIDLFPPITVTREDLLRSLKTGIAARPGELNRLNAPRKDGRVPVP